MSGLDVVGLLLVLAREAHRAVALDEGDAAAPLGMRHAHGVPQRAELAREVGDGDAARAALVDAPHAVARLGDRKERCRSFHQPFTCSSFFTEFTPLTRFATSSARCLVAGESTLPFSVTTPLSLSTLMLYMVRMPTSLASAVCTLVVRVASPTYSVFFWRPSSVTWSLDFCWPNTGVAARMADVKSAVRFMGPPVCPAQFPPDGACARITCGFSIGGRRISCSRLGRSLRS